jgi:hypothetical protein
MKRNMHAICDLNTTRHLANFLVGCYMHDAMIKILELFIKPKTFLTHREQLIQVQSTMIKEKVLKIF